MQVVRPHKQAPRQRRKAQQVQRALAQTQGRAIAATQRGGADHQPMPVPGSNAIEGVTPARQVVRQPGSLRAQAIAAAAAGHNEALGIQAHQGHAHTVGADAKQRRRIDGIAGAEAGLPSCQQQIQDQILGRGRHERIKQWASVNRRGRRLATGRGVVR